jgi:hypothetical protein
VEVEVEGPEEIRFKNGLSFGPSLSASTSTSTWVIGNGYSLHLRGYFFFMSTLKQSFKRIPYWAYLFVILVLVVNSMYLYYRLSSEILWVLVGLYIITLLF